MRMMTVWRLEDGNGEGPFHRGYVHQSRKDVERKHGQRYVDRHSPGNHPHPAAGRTSTCATAAGSSRLPNIAPGSPNRFAKL